MLGSARQGEYLSRNGPEPSQPQGQRDQNVLCPAGTSATLATSCATQFRRRPRRAEDIPRGAPGIVRVLELDALAQSWAMGRGLDLQQHRLAWRTRRE